MKYMYKIDGIENKQFDNKEEVVIHLELMSPEKRETLPGLVRCYKRDGEEFSTMRFVTTREGFVNLKRSKRK